MTENERKLIRLIAQFVSSSRGDDNVTADYHLSDMLTDINANNAESDDQLSVEEFDYLLKHASDEYKF